MNTHTKKKTLLVTCTFKRQDTDGTEWDEMNEMRVKTKQMSDII